MTNNCKCDYSEVLNKTAEQFAGQKSIETIKDSAMFSDLSNAEQGKQFQYKVNMKERTKNGKEVPRVTFISGKYCPFCGGEM